MKKGGKIHPPAALPEAELALFRAEVGPVQALSPHGRVLPETPRPRPIPRSLQQDERTALLDSMQDPRCWDADAEADADAAYLRTGIDRQVLRRLRRGEWRIQGSSQKTENKAR